MSNTVRISLFALLSGVAFAANASIHAPRVDKEIHIVWEGGKPKVAIDDGNFVPLEKDAVFVAGRPIVATYSGFNPLKTRLTSTLTLADDPSFLALQQLLTGFQSLGTTLGLPNFPKNLGALAPFAAAGRASVCADATADINTLWDSLKLVDKNDKDHKPISIPKMITEWVALSQPSSAKPGPVAIPAATAEIRKNGETIAAFAKEAQGAWDRILACASTTGADPNYQLAALTGQGDRILKLKALAASARDLANSLAAFANPNRWLGPDRFIIGESINPTFQKQVAVSLKAEKIELSFNETDNSLSSNLTADGTATFVVQKFSRLVPEIGVGAVFSTVTAPQYGTGKNSAGQTVVAKSPDRSLAVNPSVLANFMCRCGSGLLAPMGQIGVATSKDLPAILLGGGIRLFGFGAGDIAISGGWAVSWFKDLQKLQVGSVISGSTDIDADLAYTTKPRKGGYFAIQYRF